MPAASAVTPIGKFGCNIPYFCVVRFQVVLPERHMVQDDDSSATRCQITDKTVIISPSTMGNRDDTGKTLQITGKEEIWRIHIQLPLPWSSRTPGNDNQERKKDLHIIYSEERPLS